MKIERSRTAERYSNFTEAFRDVSRGLARAYAVPDTFYEQPASMERFEKGISIINSAKEFLDHVHYDQGKAAGIVEDLATSHKLTDIGVTISPEEFLRVGPDAEATGRSLTIAALAQRAAWLESLLSPNGIPDAYATAQTQVRRALSVVERAASKAYDWNTNWGKLSVDNALDQAKGAVTRQKIAQASMVGILALAGCGPITVSFTTPEIPTSQGPTPTSSEVVPAMTETPVSTATATPELTQTQISTPAETATVTAEPTSTPEKLTTVAAEVDKFLKAEGEYSEENIINELTFRLAANVETKPGVVEVFYDPNPVSTVTVQGILLGSLDVEGTNVLILGAEDLSGNRKVTAVQFSAPGLGPSADCPNAQCRYTGRVWEQVTVWCGLLTSEEELDTLLAERQGKAVAFLFDLSAEPPPTEAEIQSMKERGYDPKKGAALSAILTDRIPEARSLMFGVWRPTAVDKDKLPHGMYSGYAILNTIQSGNGPLPIEINNPQDLNNLKNNLGSLPVTVQIIYWK
jgi:hypothetical protein